MPNFHSIPMGIKREFHTMRTLEDWDMHLLPSVQPIPRRLEISRCPAWSGLAHRPAGTHPASATGTHVVGRAPVSCTPSPRPITRTLQGHHRDGRGPHVREDKPTAAEQEREPPPPYTRLDHIPISTNELCAGCQKTQSLFPTPGGAPQLAPTLALDHPAAPAWQQRSGTMSPRGRPMSNTGPRVKIRLGSPPQSADVGPRALSMRPGPPQPPAQGGRVPSRQSAATCVCP